MPSMEETKRQVRESLESMSGEIDHDAILADMEAEIDEHNNDMDREDRDHRHREHRKRRRETEHDKSRTSRRFRFKSGISDPRRHERRHRSHRHRSPHEKGERSKVESQDSKTKDAAHPFPREPTDPTRSGPEDPNAAFRESLFDALADDEGAAYWESVYNQPIHVYPRPTVETAKGELEEMDDDQYAAYVQTKMWEKTHPHIVKERERTAKRKKEEEEETARRREEYVRRKERAAWERAQQKGARKFAGMDEEDGDGYEYVFDFEGKTNGASRRTSDGSGLEDFRQAWSKYLSAWDKLKIELLQQHTAASEDGSASLSKRIPWPVLPSQPVVKPNIEAFFRQMPSDQDERSRLQLLKAERVRWHPDKIQHRFGGQVDDGTMKLVTGIFQIIDELVESERQRTS